MQNITLQMAVTQSGQPLTVEIPGVRAQLTAACFKGVARSSWRVDSTCCFIKAPPSYTCVSNSV